MLNAECLSVCVEKLQVRVDFTPLFDSRNDVEGYQLVNVEQHYPRFVARDNKAREDYLSLVERQKPQLDDLFILDILREGMTPDDPRLQSHVSCRR